jgi:hypothetical protein
MNYFEIIVSYLEDKITKTKKNSALRIFWGGVLGFFGEFFAFWDTFKILYFFIFRTLKKLFLV